MQVTVDTLLNNNYYRVICFNTTDSLISNSALLTVITPSGIAGHYLNSLSVYPNPAHGFVYIPEGKKGILLIFNAKGKQVKQIEARLKKTKVNVSDLENGLYLLKFIDNKGKISVAKIVIQ